jgi:hypothetical protein
VQISCRIKEENVRWKEWREKKESKGKGYLNKSRDEIHNDPL